MLVYGPQAQRQLRCHSPIGLPAAACDEGHGHTAPARWQCIE
jgi:hypothetical protein